MCGLCILGILISEIIKRSFTNKQIGTLPFLTKKQHKMNFNPTICLAGQDRESYFNIYGNNVTGNIILIV